jgi:hypothetical protein
MGSDQQPPAAAEATQHTVPRKVVAATAGSGVGSVLGVTLADPITNVIAWALQQFGGVAMPDGVQHSVSAILNVALTVAGTFFSAWFVPERDS